MVHARLCIFSSIGAVVALSCQERVATTHCAEKSQASSFLQRARSVSQSQISARRPNGYTLVQIERKATVEPWKMREVPQLAQATSSTSSCEVMTRPLSRDTICATLFSVLLCILWSIVYLGIRWSDDGDTGTPSDVDRFEVLDTAKLFFITLVMLWHIQTMLPYPPIMFVAFHSRGFIFVSGVVSRKPPSAQAFEKITFRLVVPIILYCCVVKPFVLPVMTWRYTEFENIDRIVQSLFKANGSVVWFLYALVMWKIWGFLLLPFRSSVKIVTAVVVSALSGYVDLGTVLDNQGAFAIGMATNMFPLFVLGQEFPFGMMLRCAPWSPVRAFMCTLLLVTVALLESTESGFEFMNNMSRGNWCMTNVTNLTDGAEVAMRWIGGFFFNMFQATKILLVIFVCLPRGPSVVSSLGKHTMYAFLLHDSVVDVLVGLKNDNKFADPCLATQYAICVLTCAFLCSRPVRFIFQLFFEPTWLERLCLGSSKGADSAG